MRKGEGQQALVELAERCETQAIHMLKNEVGAEVYSVQSATYSARLLQCAAALRTLSHPSEKDG